MVIPVELDDRIDLNAVWAVAVEGSKVRVSGAARARMAASEALLRRFVDERRRIYGVTTGYGPQAGYHVAPEGADRLQRNLLYHLATGVGTPLSPQLTRAMMIARVANLARGHSGIGQPTFTLLVECLNRNVLPVVPEMGTVGASGDLTPLAHLGLLLIGEGDATIDGEHVPARQALARASLEPVELGAKEGLALVNGTAAMTGIAAHNGARAQRALHAALRFGALYAECLEAHREAFDARFGSARPHPGQRLAHRLLGTLLADSARLQPSLQPPPLLDVGEIDGSVEHDLPQDPYSVRCLPQIFGAAFDVLDFHNRIVEIELNSATDNPLIFATDDAILHGGNFFGQHVGTASDALALGLINVAVHSERRIARLTDPQQNLGLPAFLHAPPSGLNSGFMGAQVTASALVAEMRSLATPASIQSIPTNANNQDVVPMGTIAARKASRLLDLLWLLLAIEALILAQAVELIEARGPASGAFSGRGRRLVAWIRSQSAHLGGDRPLSGDIATVARALERVDLHVSEAYEPQWFSLAPNGSAWHR
jgi:tyrosine ammonia-lyase